MTNPAQQISQLVKDEANRQVFRAIVVTLPAEGGALVRRDGSLELEGPYVVLRPITLVLGDEVVLTRVGAGYVVVGKIRHSAAGDIPAVDFDYIASSGPVTCDRVGLVNGDPDKLIDFSDTLLLGIGTWVLFADAQFFGGSYDPTNFFLAFAGIALYVRTSANVVVDRLLEGWTQYTTRYHSLSLLTCVTVTTPTRYKVTVSASLPQNVYLWGFGAWRVV